MTTILHVEDDEFLAEAVKDAFEALGFRGMYVVAPSVANARKLVRDAGSGHPPDLVSFLFPAIPTAMTALRDVAASTLEEVASWIDAHCTDDDLRAHIAPLRADAARIRTAGDVHEAAQAAL